MIFILGMETVRVTVFVSSFTIFFANLITLVLDASVSSKAAHFVSASTASILLRIMKGAFLYVLQCRFIHTVIYQLIDWDG